MYAFLTSLILLLVALPAAAQTCCCCGDGDPTPPSTPDPAIWTPYDGDGKAATGPNGSPITETDQQASLSCSAFNRAAFRLWTNPGGDWVDANNTAQGVVPFASLSIGRLTNATIEMDATALMSAEGIVVRNNDGTPVTFASREHDTAAYQPRLVVTLADSSVQELVPIADASMQKAGTVCNSKGIGKNVQMSLGHAVIIAFPAPPATAVSAKLRLTVLSSLGSTSLRLFKMVVPRKPLDPPTVGNPAEATVYYYEGWEDKFWWTRTGATIVPDAQWTGDQNAFKRPNQSGLAFANGGAPYPAQGAPGVLVPRQTGKVGTGLLIIHHPSCLACGVELENANLLLLRPRVGEPAEEIEEAWLTYHIKFGSDFGHSINCEGGKLPGLASYTDVCANSGITGNGYCGWSLRNGYTLICDPNNPAYGKVHVYIYAYHGLQPDYNGQAWPGTELSLLDQNKWYCIEQHVKVNTPGVADGIADVYVDGRLAVSRHNVYLRGVKPPQGFGDWRLLSQYPASQYPAALTAPQVTDSFGRKLWFAGRSAAPTDLKIRKAFMAIHNGGKKPWGAVATEWIDEIRMTDKRYGCS